MKQGPFSKVATATAFTLVEMLVVVALIAAIAMLAVPAFDALRKSSGLTNTASTIANLLQQARSYAMGRNTYVYIGLEEVDALQAAPGPSQTANPGIGRLAVAIVSRSDGNRGYDSDATGSPLWSNYGSGGNFAAPTPLRLFDGVHLADLGAPSSSGEMARPAVDSAYRLGSSTSTSATPFAWPLGRSLGAGQYNFTLVIQFDPQGSARILLPGHGDAIPKGIEIGLKPSRGNIAPDPATTEGGGGDQAAIQITGVSGAVHVYRP